ncbi:nucleotidyltransferase domain-containing protein [Methanoregula formicica]|nr:nucleotidyltransferase domain-containing protein [Methanoregula formicica]
MQTPIQKIVEIVTRTADPDRIILFGSRARRNNKKQSDYDICVIKRGITLRRDLAMQIYRNLYGVGVAVDVIVETPDAFDELKDNPFLIYHDIAHQGKVIYEKPVACSGSGWAGGSGIRGAVYRLSHAIGKFVYKLRYLREWIFLRVR